MSVQLNEKTPALLAKALLVNLGDTATSQTIYTVPAGFTCILDRVIIRQFSATAASCIVTVGQTGALTDFLGSMTLTACNSTNSVAILRPIPSGTVVKHIEYTPGTALILDVGTAAGGACTATVEFYGTLYTV
jgi:hypothetical protein